MTRIVRRNLNRIGAAMGGASIAAVAFVGLAPAAQADSGPCSSMGCAFDIHSQWYEGARGGGGGMLASIE